ncbi:hypothetical protein EK21DRAFT_113597 [Setomelanomma holmii]|uniref:Rhodopsin domain-containing protein n=1 Tax=Setomelanomma holmii TaxID=210430 RepID=A0A9P4LLK0_9PLEO|nr:hypothetical protein EK21DRAFT_113597 [Setomelanomma holmii]
MGANNSVPADYSAAAYAILATDILLTTTAVVGRTASQKLMKTIPAIDDYLCYLAYTSNLGLLVSGLLLTAFGTLDLTDVSVQSDSERRFVKSAYDSLAIMYILAVTFVKLSILLFYRRTFTMFEQWFRWCWWLLLGLILLWTAACIVLFALQVAGNLPKIGFSRLGISTTGVINALSDVLLIVLPAVMVSRLRMQKKQKIALISIFGIGGIASVVSLVRATIFFSNRDHRLNEAYSNYLDIVLTATESSAGLICACLPLTKPVVIRFTRWLQRLGGLNTDHQGWTTVSTSVKSTRKEKQRVTERMDDFHIQLLPMSQLTTTQAGLGGQTVTEVEKHWQSIGSYEVSSRCEAVAPRISCDLNEAGWEMQTTWGRGTT